LRKEGKFYHLVEDWSARLHKTQSTPVNGPNFKSTATPSSLAEDSSEMFFFSQGAMTIPPGHYSTAPNLTFLIKFNKFGFGR